MDELIRRFDATVDGDLMLCPSRGIAYQADMTQRVDIDYWTKCFGYDESEIAERLNEGRCAFVDDHLRADGAAAKLLDIGIGSGAFIRWRDGNTWGRDVDPSAIDWLKSEGLWAEDIDAFRAFSMWDVIEHVDEPNHYFRHMPQGSWFFCSLPIFDDLNRIRESKHYRPGEHLYYFTAHGFVDWMAEYRWRAIEESDFETRAGREQILSFAFKRTLPGYHETVAQYRKLYEPFYGASARDLYLDLIAPEVFALNPRSILDYGCGRSDLAAHFWADGRRRISRFDPAIPGCEVMPEGEFDLVLCCDVMEHVRLEDVGRVLAEIRGKSNRALFAISLRPARAVLPDGRNAHVSLLTAGEWRGWIKDVFGRAKTIPSPWDHMLILRTF